MANRASQHQPEPSVEPVISHRAATLWWNTSAKKRGLRNIFDGFADEWSRPTSRRVVPDPRPAAPAEAAPATGGTLGDRAYALDRAGVKPDQIARELNVSRKRVSGLIRQGQRRAR